MAASDQHDTIIRHYMEDLKWALRDLPSPRRQQILDEIAEHIQTARAQLRQEDASSVRQILEQVGDPETIRLSAGLPRVAPPSSWDRWVPWLLLLGGFLFLIGWVFGLVLLWQSRTWSTLEKILGTLIWPGGLAAVFLFVGLPTGGATTSSCVSQGGGGAHCVTMGSHVLVAVGLLMLVVAVVAPLAVMVRLIWRSRQFHTV